ncbi:MAG TPA: DUF4926 domain-containing protein [Thermodesulfovibrionia bacterium]|nr:DUF4926 domain-containing protein [Thermodesulfovibrionia bacterium]
MKELDTVVLTHDIKEYGLTEGDIGAIVHCYSDSNAYEVEFVTAEGKTIAVLTLSPDDIRVMKEREILHVREIAQQTI